MIRTLRLALGAGALVASIAPFGPACGQGVMLLASGRAAEIPFGFTHVTGVFELHGGSVVVVDRGDAALLLADFARRVVRPLGRNGSGPGEYRVPMFLYPLGGDSVGVLDDAAGRLLVVTADGRPGGFLAPRSTDTRPGFTAAARFGDGRGYFYGEGASIRVAIDGTPQLADSSPILRWPIDGGPSSAIAFVPRPVPAGARVVGGSMVVAAPGGARPALLSRALWAVAADGRVAIVHPEPYRVQFIAPEGVSLSDAALPFVSVAVNDSVKHAYLAELELDENFVMDGKTGTVNVERRSRRSRPPASWVANVPPFRAEALVAFDRRGVLWIQRTTFGREGASYDLIGPNARLIARVRLPDGHRVVGFGTNTVYVIRRDADDLEYLQRLPLPVLP